MPRLELCTFTLAVSLGAVLLLPFSIISNEVLLSLPRNYYIQWLNGSLIHGVWLLAGTDSFGLISQNHLIPGSLTIWLAPTGLGLPFPDHLCLFFFALGLWNLVFLFSNLSLIFLMPFAYFFTESEGFAGSRKVSGGYINQSRQEIEFHSYGSTEEILMKRLFAEVYSELRGPTKSLRC